MTTVLIDNSVVRYPVTKPKAMYRMFLRDLKDFSGIATDLISDIDSQVEYKILGIKESIDAIYELQIFDEDDNLVIQDTLSIVSGKINSLINGGKI